MRACVRGCERFAEHVQHPGLPFSLKILHVIITGFNYTTKHISPKCLHEQNVQLSVDALNMFHMERGRYSFHSPQDMNPHIPPCHY
jgi:hypothetical protein